MIKMPCKRYPKFDPIKAVTILGLDDGEKKFPRGYAIFDDLPMTRVEKAYRRSGMDKYPQSKYKKNAPPINDFFEWGEEEDLYLSGEVVPCDVKEEGKMSINVICLTPRRTHTFTKFDDTWLQSIEGLNYRCYGWSDIGWKTPKTKEEK